MSKAEEQEYYFRADLITDVGNVAGGKSVLYYKSA